MDQDKENEAVKSILIAPAELEKYERQGWLLVGLRRERDNVTLLKLQKPIPRVD